MVLRPEVPALAPVCECPFLGGGQWPWPLSFLNSSGWLQFVAFLIKTFIFLFVFIWLRGTLPRDRYDQSMRLGWTALVPLSLLWILVVFALRTLPAARPCSPR